jgi:hypothetical protein
VIDRAVREKAAMDADVRTLGIPEDEREIFRAAHVELIGTAAGEGDVGLEAPFFRTHEFGSVPALAASFQLAWSATAFGCLVAHCSTRLSDEEGTS